MRRFFLLILLSLFFLQASAQDNIKTDLLAPVKMNGKWGYINTDGMWVIEPIFEEANAFSEKIAAAKLNGMWGYIDKTGKWVMAPVLVNAGSFNNNRAPVTYFDHVDSILYHVYIDKKGVYVFEVPFTEPTWGYHDGLVRVRGTSDWGTVTYGFRDTTGEWFIKPKYGDATDFSNGMAAVKYLDKWGYIDRNDSVRIPMIYDEAFVFNDEMARVKQGDDYMLINKQGEVLLKTRYELDYLAQDSLIGFRKKGKYGFMNLDGKIVVKPEYENIVFNKFSEGLAVVIKNVDEKTLFGYVNANGTEVIPPRFEYALPFRNGFAVVKYNGKYGFIDKTGNWLKPPGYDEAISFMPTYY